MSDDSDAGSLAPDGNDARPLTFRHVFSTATLKYLLFIAIPITWVVSGFLDYSAPDISDRILWAYPACVLALSVLFLGALFGRRWKEIAIFCAMSPVVLLPYLGLNEPLRWFRVEGFRFYVSPVQKYKSNCKLIEFLEKGARQQLGVCERRWQIGGGTLTVIYDTTGELMLPLSQRTPEWAKAMGRFSPGKFLTQSEDRAERLFGNFYEISVPLREHDGAPDDY